MLAGLFYSMDICLRDTKQVPASLAPTHHARSAAESAAETEQAFFTAGTAAPEVQTFCVLPAGIRNRCPAIPYTGKVRPVRLHLFIKCTTYEIQAILPGTRICLR